MNVDNAIMAHTKWKMTLRSYIAKPDRSLDAISVGTPSHCELGKWLEGEGRKHSNLPEFSKLSSEHARFHKAAAEVIKRADAGTSVDDEIALGSKSDFATASSSVVKALMDIKAKI